MINKPQHLFYSRCHWQLALLFLLMVLVFTGCNGSSSRSPQGESSSATTAADSVAPSQQPEPNRKADIKYAKSFEIFYYDNFKIAKVFNPWQGEKDKSIKYLIVPKGSAIKGQYDEYYVIRTPIESVACLSTTHLPMMEALNEEEKIVGVANGDYVYDKSISERIEKGDIKQVGVDRVLNKELLVETDPDLVMAYGIGGKNNKRYSKLQDLGLQVVMNAEYMENSPLGRAEWIKFVGAFLGKQEQAKEVFQEIEKKYLALKNKASDVNNEPTVLSGLPYKDVWSMPGGKSYGAQFIEHAGGDYLFSDNEKRGSLQLNLEAVFQRGADADVWVNTNKAESIQHILSMDERFGQFKAIQEGAVYNNNKRRTPEGGIDFYESGVLNPHIILKDLMKIFHPELVPGHTLYYYQKLPRTKDQSSS